MGKYSIPRRLLIYSDPTGNGPLGIQQYDMGGGAAIISATIKPVLNVKPKEVIAATLTALAIKEKIKDKEKKKEEKKDTNDLDKLREKGNPYPKYKVSNKGSLPKEGEPNSSIDKLNSDGTHTFPHRHKWDWNQKNQDWIVDNNYKKFRE